MSKDTLTRKKAEGGPPPDSSLLESLLALLVGGAILTLLLQRTGNSAPSTKTKGLLENAELQSPTKHVVVQGERPQEIELFRKLNISPGNIEVEMLGPKDRWSRGWRRLLKDLGPLATVAATVLAALTGYFSYTMGRDAELARRTEERAKLIQNLEVSTKQDMTGLLLAAQGKEALDDIQAALGSDKEEIQAGASVAMRAVIRKEEFRAVALLKLQEEFERGTAVERRGVLRALKELEHGLSPQEASVFFTIANTKLGPQVERCAQALDDKGAILFVSWSAEWTEKDVYVRLLGVLKNCPVEFQARRHALNGIIDDSIGKPPQSACAGIINELEHLPNISGDLVTLRAAAAKKVADRCGQSP